MLESENIKFISYTGRYPNLCSGVLTLNIDGKEVKFGHELDSFDGKTNKYIDNNYDSFWSSGGGIRSNYPEESYEVSEDEWIINEEDIPKQYQKYAYEIGEVFNANVPYGCCGGCIW